MPDGTTFISGTLVNDSGTQQIGNPANGIQIGNINPSGMAVITINALVINIPSINPISNSSSVQFQHIVNPSQPVITQTASSNTVITTINSAILTTTKSADKSIISVGDTITYTTTITNTGNSTAKNKNLQALFQLTLHLYQIQSQSMVFSNLVHSQLLE